MMKFKSFLSLGVILCIAQVSVSQSVFGKWKTIDDRNGIEKAIIEVYEKEGLLFGRVLEILEEGKEDAVCEKCDDHRKDKPVEGMEIITAAVKTDTNEYKGKHLFDPEQAMTFRCKIWLDPEDEDQLKVRGYLAFIYRTQTWVRVKE
tara:strand:- start:438 stop:878 length:441 start_codon:yes stop_codon:yes gene_type:complete